MLLLFGAVWMFPLITALVAGDIVASEDHNGTLKTIFTRSLERGQIFAGKALAAATYAVAAIVLSGTVAVIAGSIQSGFNSLQSLSGTIVSAPKALELVYVSLLVYLIPIARDRLHRAAAVLDHPQQRGRGRRHADGLAADPADRHPARAGRPAALPAEHPVQRLAGTAAHADRLGADRARGVGVRAVRRSRRWSPRTWCSCAATSPVADDLRHRRLAASASSSSTTIRRCGGCSSARSAAEGFEVTVAADGGAALVAAERSAPDVIVLDVAMPVLDGLAVCRRLRGKGLPTPILMLTARDAVPDRVAGLEAGADDYLVKPFAVQELIARIRALTRRLIEAAAAARLRRPGARRARRARPRAAGGRSS